MCIRDRDKGDFWVQLKKSFRKRNGERMPGFVKWKFESVGKNKSDLEGLSRCH